MSEPFLRWAGNKRRLLPVLRLALPPGRRLIEPFLGAASVFLGTTYPAYLLNDANADLIDLYRILRDRTDELLAAARELFRANRSDQDTYGRLRRHFNAAPPGSLERAATFLWLNATCFNGLCRYSAEGAFNVPRGGRSTPPSLPEARLRAFAAKARQDGVIFRQGDFSAVMAEAGEGDVVYCAPPYLPRSSTASFTRYARDGFPPERHEELAAAARAAAARGASVVISNSDTPATRALHADALLLPARLPHLVGGPARSRAGELLLLHGPDRGAPLWRLARPTEAPHAAPTPRDRQPRLPLALHADMAPAP